MFSTKAKMISVATKAVVSLRGQVLPEENEVAVLLQFHFKREMAERLALSVSNALVLYRAMQEHLRRGHCNLQAIAQHDVIAQRLAELNSDYAKAVDDSTNLVEDTVVATKL